MPHFILRCTDSDSAAELRPLHRDAHVAHLRASGVTRLAGRMRNAAGDVVGSLLIVEAADADAVEAFSQADPFRRHGVYRATEIVPFEITIIDMPAQN